MMVSNLRMPRSTAAVLLLLIIIALLSSTIQAEEDTNTCQWVENTNACIATQQPECGLYMAPSTLGENANMGMYAGPKGFSKDHVIQGEIVIPLLFRDFEETLYWTEVEGGDQMKDDGSLWHRYIWNGFVAEIESYSIENIQDQRAVFVPGIGCTINSILELRNVQSTTGSEYDTAGVQRGDPQAGAFSPYHNSVTTTVRPIPPGGEIFTDYGDEWIPDIPGAQITIDHVMDAAEDFLRDDYLPFIQKHQSAMTPELLEGLWNFTRDFPHPNPKTFSVLPRNVDWKTIQSKLEELIQKELEILKNRLIAQAVANNDSDEFDYDYEPPLPQYTEEASVVRHFIRQLGQRDQSWLEEHGRCCDHMTPKESTIKGAGRGAFATRKLPQGTIVGYSPLVHVGVFGEELYNVPYTFKDGSREDYNKTDLVVNYAFGHPESDVLLSPYGCMVNYINHAPADKANVRVVWPDKEMVAHKPAWLLENVDYLSNTVEKIGLSLDYVALRDIEEGEEIFMDYGPDWEAAWEEHLQSWEPPEDADEYVHSSDWDETHLRTIREQIDNPYPPNLHTICIPAYSYDAATNNNYYAELDTEYMDRVECTVLERFVDDEDDEDSDATYTVRMEKEKQVIVLDFPADHVFLTDRIMSQDWHLPNTFRHWIGLPDDIFPEMWRNLDDDDDDDDGGDEDENENDSNDNEGEEGDSDSDSDDDDDETEEGEDELDYEDEE